MERETRELTFVRQAQRALAEASSVQDVKSFRDKAEAARSYFKSAAMGLELLNEAAEFKLRRLWPLTWISERSLPSTASHRRIPMRSSADTSSLPSSENLIQRTAPW